jgi:hypothetical protein
MEDEMEEPLSIFARVYDIPYYGSHGGPGFK